MNVETLRYYERRGLLPEPERTPSGHRRYDEETVRFLGAIKEAQAVGFTLAEIAEYLRAARRSGAPSEALRVRMAAKIDQIDARIAALRRMRDELAASSAAPASRSTTAPAAPPTSRAAARRRGAAFAPAHHQRRKRGQHAASDRARRRRAAVAGRAPRRAGTGATTAAAVADACPLPRRLRLGSPAGAALALERRDRQLLEALRDGIEVVLWFEHDLYDQLQLLDVLALAHTEEAAPELIVIGSFPGKPSFAGLGELTASELETLWPSRSRAAPAALQGGEAPGPPSRPRSRRH